MSSCGAVRYLGGLTPSSLPGRIVFTSLAGKMGKRDLGSSVHHIHCLDSSASVSCLCFLWLLSSLRKSISSLPPPPTPHQPLTPDSVEDLKISMIIVPCGMSVWVDFCPVGLLWEWLRRVSPRLQNRTHRKERCLDYSKGTFFPLTCLGLVDGMAIVQVYSTSLVSFGETILPTLRSVILGRTFSWQHLTQRRLDKHRYGSQPCYL